MFHIKYGNLKRIKGLFSILELKGITKRYKKDKKNKKDKIALNNVNLSFKDSGLYFITGKSGSGKSTLLNILFVSVFQYAFIYKLNSIVLEQYIIPFKVDSFTITIFNYVSIIILSIVVPFVASLYSIIVCSKKSPKDILNND